MVIICPRHFFVCSGVISLIVKYTFSFLVFFFVTEKNTLCLHSRCLSVRLSSVEITFKRGSERSDEPIDLKIGLIMGN